MDDNGGSNNDGYCQACELESIVENSVDIQQMENNFDDVDDNIDDIQNNIDELSDRAIR